MSDDTSEKKRKKEPAPPSKAVLEFTLRLPRKSCLEQKPKVAVVLP